MARKFVEVEVSKMLRSSVFIAFDDEKEEHKELLESGKITWKGLRKLRKAAVDASEELDSTDWEEEDEIEIEGGKVVDESEALQYTCWDADAKDVLNP
jgi:hypothetical protein